jgi:hypothetical protein
LNAQHAFFSLSSCGGSSRLLQNTIGGFGESYGDEIGLYRLACDVPAYDVPGYPVPSYGVPGQFVFAVAAANRNTAWNETQTPSAIQVTLRFADSSVAIAEDSWARAA